MTSGSGSGSGSSRAVSSQEYESSELVKFRAEWKAELESRKRARQTELQASTSSAAAHNSGDNASTATPGPPTSTGVKHTGAPLNYPALRPQQQNGMVTLDPYPIITPGGKVVDQKWGTTLTNAISIYKQAVQHEQDGELDEALALYRQAFRMDTHVDRAFRREEMLLNIATHQAGEKLPRSPAVPAVETMLTMTQSDATQDVDDLNASMEALSTKPRIIEKGQTVLTGILGALIAAFLEREPTLTFKPEDETQHAAINVLPEEILIEILHLLDPSSLEIFALVCKRARVLTLESSIWQNLVLSTYREPQIPDLEALAEIITRHAFDYRKVFIEQPRVRTDGVYIATCHYIRPGLSENRWVNISHLITYHRYLRFYPNGQVLSLLANEDHPPQTIVNMLNPSLRMKGLHIGTWSLAGTEVVLSDLFDASGRYSVPGLTEGPPPTSHPLGHHHHHHSSDIRPRYVFVMSLGLKSRPLGRWNRLDIHSYDTLNLETGDLIPVVLKHERPFWFSKVRSYT